MKSDVILQNVHQALNEDLNHLTPEQGDITAALIPQSQNICAKLISREAGIFCGQAWANKVFEIIDPSIKIAWQVQDGDTVKPNQTLCTLLGSARGILTGERSAMNFIQTMSGVATATHNYVTTLNDAHTQILDTRKTIPGLREAQKYAVACGGGQNHRFGLFDAFLIKENHIMAAGGITQAVQAAKAFEPSKKVEVEVEDLAEFQEALAAHADIIMLDNFSLSKIKEAVAINQSQAKIEVSGNITLKTLPQYQNLGIDFISVGALTKHVQALDLSLRVVQDI
jgi:nicotinate-nucleotide pyrophosphorylase (carboxylating)